MLTSSLSATSSSGAPPSVEAPAALGPEIVRPPGRGERAWAWLEWRVSGLVGHDLNPLAHSDSLAALCFLLVLVSGLYLFLVYDVARPYASVQALDGSVVGATMRGIHRYASRALVLFVALHALRLGLAGRFRGPRWLAWETGLLQLAVVWFLGVTGYLLVWDDQAQVVGLALAGLLDGVALFVQPFRLTLLVNETVRDNIFFVVLFLHLSVPLLGAVLYLLHLSRVSRPRWVPGRRLALLFGAATLGVALLWPVRTSRPADLAWLPDALALDPWYSGFVLVGTSWALALLALGGPMLAAGLLPLVGRRRHATAHVLAETCRGCRLCAADCPYGAIGMLPLARLGAVDHGPNGRTTGADRAAEIAVVAADRCVGCGVCLGSCNFSGVVLGDLTGAALRQAVARPVDRPVRDGRPGLLVLACRWPGQPDLPPGARFLTVPCAGAVNRTVVADALRAGFGGVLVAHCGDALCAQREGGLWTRLRAERQRQPGWPAALAERVHLVEVRPGDRAALVAAVRDLQARLAAPGPAGPPAAGRSWLTPPRRRLAAGVALAALLTALTVPDLTYAPGSADAGLLKVAVRTEAPLAETRTLSEEELSGRLEHMRGQELANRERLPLAVEVLVDGETVLRTDFYPRGFRRDGPTYGYAEVPLPVGVHQVAARVTPVGGAGFAPVVLEQSVEVAPRQVRILSYGALGEGLTLR